MTPGRNAPLPSLPGQSGLASVTAAISAGANLRRSNLPKSKQPAAEPQASPAPKAPTGKLAILAELLSRPQGANLEAMMAATGWQAHSVRGAMSGGLKKGFGLTIESNKTEAGRLYRIKPSEVA